MSADPHAEVVAERERRRAARRLARSRRKRSPGPLAAPPAAEPAPVRPQVPPGRPGAPTGALGGPVIPDDMRARGHTTMIIYEPLLVTLARWQEGPDDGTT